MRLMPSSRPPDTAQQERTHRPNQEQLDPGEGDAVDQTVTVADGHDNELVVTAAAAATATSAPSAAPAPAAAVVCSLALGGQAEESPVVAVATAPPALVELQPTDDFVSAPSALFGCSLSQAQLDVPSPGADDTVSATNDTPPSAPHDAVPSAANTTTTMSSSFDGGLTTRSESDDMEIKNRAVTSAFAATFPTSATASYDGNTSVRGVMAVPAPTELITASRIQELIEICHATNTGDDTGYSFRELVRFLGRTFCDPACIRASFELTACHREKDIDDTVGAASPIDTRDVDRKSKVKGFPEQVCSAVAVTAAAQEAAVAGEKKGQERYFQNDRHLDRQ